MWRWWLLLVGIGSVWADVEYRILLRNEEVFTIHTNALYPENLLGLENGLEGNAKLLLETKGKWESVSLKFSDLAVVPIKETGLVTNTILEATMRYRWGDFYADIGKKRIITGKGFLFSPSDLFSSVSQTSGGRESDLQFKNGSIVVGGGYFSEKGHLALYYLPEVSFQNEDIARFITPPQEKAYGGWYSFTLEQMDGGVSAYYKESLALGGYASIRIGDFVVYGDIGFSEREKFLRLTKEGLPFGGDLLTQKEEEITNSIKAVGGFSTTLGNWGFMVEYFYNGKGLSTDEIKVFKEEARRIAEESEQNNPLTAANRGTLAIFLQGHAFPAFSKHYVMSRIFSVGLKTWELAGLFLASCSDWSGRFDASFTYKVNNLSLSGNAFFSFGEKYSEFRLYGNAWGIGLLIEVCL